MHLCKQWTHGIQSLEHMATRVREDLGQVWVKSIGSSIMLFSLHLSLPVPPFLLVSEYTDLCEFSEQYRRATQQSVSRAYPQNLCSTSVRLTVHVNSEGVFG